jgi:hypothetical protein
VQLRQALVAGAQTAQVVQPGERSLDDPALASQARAVVCAAAGDHGLDAALARRVPVLVVVIAAVGEQPLGAPTWARDLPGDSRQAVDERQKLGDVVAVGAGQRHGQRDAASVGQQMVLGAAARTIDG